ncbi:hypothetical protein ACA910_002300 [Epithemia clementina (nom. ined.)]
MQEPRGVFSDGRLDKFSYTREEVDQMRARKRADMEEQTHGLNQLLEEDEDVVEEGVGRGSANSGLATTTTDHRLTE